MTILDYQTMWLGRGAVIEQVANPGAGVGAWEFSVPDGKLWRPIALHAILTTDANAGSRVPTLVLDDGATTFWDIAATVSQAPSTTGRYVYAPTIGQVATSVGQGRIANPIPELVLHAGWRIRMATANIQAGDAWTGIALLVAEGAV